LTLENRAGRELGALTTIEAGFCGDVRQVESPQGWRATVRPGRITTVKLVAERPGNGIKPGRKLAGFIVHFEGPWSWASTIAYTFSKGVRGGALASPSC
jgi:hypothetical protein